MYEQNKNVNNEIDILKRITISRVWKQSKFPSMDEWIKKCVLYTHTYIQTVKYDCLKREGNSVIYNIDETGVHYGK